VSVWSAFHRRVTSAAYWSAASSHKVAGIDDGEAVVGQSFGEEFGVPERHQGVAPACNSYRCLHPGTQLMQDRNCDLFASGTPGPSYVRITGIR
jgi:hypothetical protein